VYYDPAGLLDVKGGLNIELSPLSEVEEINGGGR
jgi:hypothetical protein